MKINMAFLTFFTIFFLYHFSNYAVVVAKECTNTPTDLSSHTVRYEMNGALTEEILAHFDHVTPTDDSTWKDLFPRKIMKKEEELDWEMLYKKIKYNDLHGKSGEWGEKFLKEVSLHDVRIDHDSIHGQAQQTNLEYLLLLDVDSLVWSFRKNAGLPTPGTPYGGWEGPDVELRGHFVGHYLSATAQMWAASHNETLLAKMDAVVTALNECQEKLGRGYLSAFPSEFFDRFENIQYVWAPYYTIHKIMAGLVDQYTFAGNAQALKMVVGMADYFRNRVHNVIRKHTIERHWLSLNEEVGGMNDVLYRLYSITGDQKHLVLASLFDKPCFLGMLALKADSLSGFHANTHIPLVIGSQQRYEVTGDPLYKEISTYFMDVVNSSHSYATGGTSYSEFWDHPKRLASFLLSENEETCTTYNMLKVSRHLFRWTKEMAYADYYERALTNGVLSVQRGKEPGVMIYMLPLGPGSSKAVSKNGWGTQFNTFWCCYGTGAESFSKLGDSIYFEEEGNQGIYVIQFISSSFDWKSQGILIKQKVDPVVSWDNTLKVTLTFSTNEVAKNSSTLNLRIPHWANSTGTIAKLNDKELVLPAPGNFLSVSKNWSNGDTLSLELPMNLWTEAIKDDRLEYASIHAIFYGPYLLAGLSNGEWDLKTGTNTSPSDWITPIPSSYNSQLFSLSQQFNNETFVLTNTGNTITMTEMPNSGTNNATQATFRFVVKDDNSSMLSEGSIIGKVVEIEPFSVPGWSMEVSGQNENLVVWDSTGSERIAVFRVVEGLDKKETVSLESVSEKGCFVYSGVHQNASTRVMLKCQSKSADDADFEKGTSFKLGKGLTEYHPMSFVAHGAGKKFLMTPLLSLRDETYTVYFNLGK